MNVKIYLFQSFKKSNIFGLFCWLKLQNMNCEFIGVLQKGGEKILFYDIIILLEVKGEKYERYVKIC